MHNSGLFGLPLVIFFISRRVNNIRMLTKQGRSSTALFGKFGKTISPQRGVPVVFYEQTVLEYIGKRKNEMHQVKTQPILKVATKT